MLAGKFAAHLNVIINLIIGFFQVGIHPSAAEEFVTMRSVSRRVQGAGKPKTNL